MSRREYLKQTQAEAREWARLETERRIREGAGRKTLASLLAAAQAISELPCDPALPGPAPECPVAPHVRGK